MSSTTVWHVSGSYFETCNCTAVCPCRRQNGKPGGRSTFGVCQFFLTWYVTEGAMDGLSLSGLAVAMAGYYKDDEAGAPWRVILYVDSSAAAEQREALAAIFLGKAGGDVHFTANIAEVLAIRQVKITLDHSRGREHVHIDKLAAADALGFADFDGVVSCGIPGHHHPGRELTIEADLNDAPLIWSYAGRCGFATEFEHRS